MHEILKVKQDSPTSHKRWFNASDSDLFVWLDKDGAMERFQLCYDKFINEHAFTWSKRDGYNHYIVSDGEADTDLFMKTSPILIDQYKKKVFPKSRLFEFIKAHKNIDAPLFSAILGKIKDCPFEQIWYLYMVRTGDNSLYTGITTDINRRFEEHQAKNAKSAKYFRSKNDLQLVFRYEFENRSEASIFEAKIKKLSKVKKEMLVNGELSIMDAVE